MRPGARPLQSYVAVVAVALVAGPTPADAQGRPLEDGWRWAWFTRDQGLPGDAIDLIAETTGGIAWIATETGLAWFDGFAWRPAGRASGLSERPAAVLVPDGEGGLYTIIHNRLFAGDTSGFLPIPIRLSRRLLDPTATTDTAEYSVADVAPIGPGEALVLIRLSDAVAAPTALFFRRDETVTPAPVPGALDARARLFTTPAGPPWLAAAGGLYRWNGAGWTPAQRLAGGAVRVAALAENRDGAGLAVIDAPASERGLLSWAAGQTARRVHAEGDNPVVAMDVGPNGDAVVIYATGDLRLRHEGNWMDAPLAPPPVRQGARSVRYRADGDLWVGTDQGAFLYHAGSRRWTPHAFPFPDRRNRIESLLLRADGDLWTGTGDGVTIYRPDGAVKEVRTIDGVALGSVTGLAEDGAGHVWIGGGVALRGVFRWDGESWHHFGSSDGLPAFHVHRIVRDRHGRPWFLGQSDSGGAAAGPGAYVYTDEGFQHWGTAEGLPGGLVYAFAEGPDGARWFATDGGLSRWRAGSWTHWTRWDTRLPDGHLVRSVLLVRALATDERGRLWLADDGAGLGYVDSADAVRFVAAGPMRGARVRDLTLDPRGDPWIGGAGGLCQYRDADWACFDPAVGLATLAVGPIRATADRVYVGTLGRGLQVLDRAEERDPPPRVQVSAVVEGRAVHGRWRALAPFGAFPPSAIRTRYRLDDRPWSPWSEHREVTLDPMRAGRHTLRVQAKGPFGAFDAAGAAAPFRIAPPLLLRPAVALPLLLLGGALVIVVSAAVRHRAGARTALIESETRFRALGDAAFEGIAISEGGRVVDVNHRLAEMLGYERREMIGRPVLDFVSPQSREEVALALSGRGGPYEHLALHKEGFEFPVEVQAKPIPYRGRTIRATAVRDTRERNRAQEALRQSEEKFSKAFQASPAAMALHAADGRLLDVNASFTALYGYTRSEALGRTPRDLGLWPPAPDGESLPKLPAEFRLRVKGGGERDVRLSVERVEIAGERCLLSVGEDLTAERRAQRALEASQQELRRLSRRLMEIQETERANLSRELHDQIGQVLATVKLNLVAIGRLSDAPALREQVEDAMALIDGGVAEVRELARELRPSLLDDLGLAEALAWFTARQSERANIAIAYSAETGAERAPREVETACYRIAQEAITNVLRHAGARHVEVSLRTGGGALVLTVRDDGIGFEPTSVATDRAGSAAPLGLLGMRERATFAGGRLDIEATPGAGTTIRARFPLRRPAPAAAPLGS